MEILKRLEELRKENRKLKSYPCTADDNAMIRINNVQIEKLKAKIQINKLIEKQENAISMRDWNKLENKIKNLKKELCNF